MKKQIQSRSKKSSIVPPHDPNSCWFCVDDMEREARLKRVVALLWPPKKKK